jgi:hypothetical protein
MKAEARKLGADTLINPRVEPERGGGTYLTPDGAVSEGGSQLWSATAAVRVER